MGGLHGSRAERLALGAPAAPRLLTISGMLRRGRALGDKITVESLSGLDGEGQV